MMARLLRWLGFSKAPETRRINREVRAAVHENRNQAMKAMAAVRVEQAHTDKIVADTEKSIRRLEQTASERAIRAASDAVDIARGLRKS